MAANFAQSSQWYVRIAGAIGVSLILIVGTAVRTAGARSLARSKNWIVPKSQLEKYANIKDRAYLDPMQLKRIKIYHMRGASLAPHTLGVGIEGRQPARSGARRVNLLVCPPASSCTHAHSLAHSATHRIAELLAHKLLDSSRRQRAVMQMLGERTCTPQRVISTASVLYHRFYSKCAPRSLARSLVAGRQ